MRSVAAAAQRSAAHPSITISSSGNSFQLELELATVARFVLGGNALPSKTFHAEGSGSGQRAAGIGSGLYLHSSVAKQNKSTGFICNGAADGAADGVGVGVGVQGRGETPLGWRRTRSVVAERVKGSDCLALIIKVAAGNEAGQGRARQGTAASFSCLSWE